MRILLVDDEAGIREGIAALLRRRGHDVRTAADLAPAHALLAEVVFDCVLSDWHLPSGTAAPLLARTPCPFVAMSGHPEEIAPTPSLTAVLRKPVPLDELLALLSGIEVATAPPTPTVGLASLPLDVRAVCERALHLLVGPGAGTTTATGARLVDDGTFVTLVAPWPGDHLLPDFAPLGGDLRILAPAGGPLLELRWLRDGRPDVAVPVTPAASDWPEVPRLCVDFDAATGDAAAFVQLLDCVARRRAAGRETWFLNVAPALRAAATAAGRGADLPVGHRIGPILPAVLADLWGR